MTKGWLGSGREKREGWRRGRMREVMLSAGEEKEEKLSDDAK